MAASGTSNKQQPAGPLAPAAAHILLAIGPESRHGYAIMSEIARITDGAVRMGPGTLYGTIKKLLADGLIEEREGGGDNERRRYYRLTNMGVAAVAHEAARMEALLGRSGVRNWAMGREP